MRDAGNLNRDFVHVEEELGEYAEPGRDTESTEERGKDPERA